MASMIGIKIANGNFYPVLAAQEEGKKRLLLTTAHDNQEILHIELYKSVHKTLAPACYLGTLVVKPIKPARQGEPAIQLEVAFKPPGEIYADAVNLDPSSGYAKYSLRVPLIPGDPEGGALREPVGIPPPGLYETESERKGLIGLLPLLLGLWFFLFREKFPLHLPGAAPVIASARSPGDPRTGGVSEGPVPLEAAPAGTEAAEPPAIPEAPAPRAEVPVIKAPAVAPNRNRPSPPVASYKVPATIPRSGVPYRIRWGDTLWDISEAFYRNPWLYPRIARFNNIRRPDRIVAGRIIRIPPRN
ncbi:MAG: LysM peptidoglycan-binding domain-containing protein [Treponema sp.]|jgi:LysM repeat protein|nr:LysM peptidoglycan-binding domain-containing protein [Treponema sp.]